MEEEEKRQVAEVFWKKGYSAKRGGRRRKLPGGRGSCSQAARAKLAPGDIERSLGIYVDHGGRNTCELRHDVKSGGETTPAEGCRACGSFYVPRFCSPTGVGFCANKRCHRPEKMVEGVPDGYLNIYTVGMLFAK